MTAAAAAAPRILVVEDERDIRESFCAILEAEGFRVQGARTIAEARDTLTKLGPSLCLLDVGLPDGNGLDLIPSMLSLDPPPTIVVVTAETKVETAVQAMKAGATDYLEKPIGLDRLLTTARLCLERRALTLENRELRHQALDRWRILGHSAAITSLQDKLDRIADSDIPVLISGENGTGKELIARQLHLRSKRYRDRFVATNCAAIPETLIEAEFFGHAKGAFTGADRARDGWFVQAGSGTVFLDEIGEMPASLQARLLRVLQEHRVTPLGSADSRELDCRIVTATNRDLAAAIEDGSFREDLYYRIRGVELVVPPLRDRGDDVVLLAEHFLEEELAEKPRDLTFSAAARSWLVSQPWPGNVRQLRSLIRAAALLLDEGEIDVDGLESLARPQRGAAEPTSDDRGSFFAIENLREFRNAVEKEYLRRKLEEESWNVSATARRIGIRRTNLHDRLRLHGLK
ncbi:MAG: sigma-54-dependent Fis family transcriptional regulator [Planctomycetes bacterium]|nr:sigma-54-dependent Fis family transcriptional regulator [Planctomycetota bacterium]MCB9918340.1 sigma-54-dependent Fis family transcriptional regulator [Planctomycetota bacterium]